MSICSLQKIAACAHPVPVMKFEEKLADLFSPVWVRRWNRYSARMAQLNEFGGVYNRKTNSAGPRAPQTTGQKVNLYEKVQIPGTRTLRPQDQMLHGG